jgi:uncharacterized protein YjeT (DUF2065 family)
VRRQEAARVALATIRLVNGLAALLTPRKMLRRLGVDPDANGAAIYALRMFGIRTIILGAELLVAKGERLDEALRTAPLIHASDAASAFITVVREELPRRSAVLVTIISSINTCLAFLARHRDQAGELTGVERA